MKQGTQDRKEERTQSFGEAYRKNKRSELDAKLSRLESNPLYQKMKANHELTWGTPENPISDHENMVGLSTSPNEPRVSKKEYVSHLESCVEKAQDNLMKARNKRTRKDYEEDCKRSTRVGEDGKRYGLAWKVVALTFEGVVGGWPSESEKNNHISKAKMNLQRASDKYSEFLKYETNRDNNKRIHFKERIGTVLRRMGNCLSPIADETDDTQAYTTWLKANTIKIGNE